MKRWIGILLTVALLAGLIGWRLKGKAAGVAAQKAAITARQKSARRGNCCPCIPDGCRSQLYRHWQRRIAV